MLETYSVFTYVAIYSYFLAQVKYALFNAFILSFYVNDTYFNLA